VLKEIRDLKETKELKDHHLREHKGRKDHRLKV
jgi:hypothetical protein